MATCKQEAGLQWLAQLLLEADLLTEYTSYAEIRAVLGVSSKELEDATLSLPLYERLLTQELDDIDSSLNESYLEVAAINEASRTSAQKKFFNVTQVFSAYAISKILLTSLPYFGPKRVTDGRAEAERFTDPFEDTRDGVDAALGAIRSRLIAALNGLGVVTATPRVVRSYFTSTGPDIDPVTQ